MFSKQGFSSGGLSREKVNPLLNSKERLYIKNQVETDNPVGLCWFDSGEKSSCVHHCLWFFNGNITEEMFRNRVAGESTKSSTAFRPPAAKTRAPGCARSSFQEPVNSWAMAMDGGWDWATRTQIIYIHIYIHILLGIMILIGISLITRNMLSRLLKLLSW